MGIYWNPGNQGFWQSINSEIYVDKTGLIEYTNKVLNTKQRFVCVSRPRRFGKSMAAEMLVAYYDRECDSRELFEGYQIEKAKSFEKHLNKYNVISLNMLDFYKIGKPVEEMLEKLEKALLWEILDTYPDIRYYDTTDLVRVLLDAYKNTKIPIIFVIDEWDCIFREGKEDKEGQKIYLDFLRNLLKDKTYVGLAYMTGILPVKKYGTHSALNMFEEYSMTRAEQMAEYMGFTEAEVEKLCLTHQRDFDEIKKWYDGYQLEKLHVYSPKSVVSAIEKGKFRSYWVSTETYEALKIYIDMNMDGLKDSIIEMLGGGRCNIDPETFQNDMTTFRNKEDVISLLVHLGYLAYDEEKEEAFIPNMEIQAEFVRAMQDEKWSVVIDAVKDSEELLEATLNKNETAVARAIDIVHMNTTSILTYNSENSLSCCLTIAYYSARKDYTIIRELPRGKGYADLIFLPRKGSEKPALVIELKWDKKAETAIHQIKNKRYTEHIKDFTGKILLVGINYDKDSKEHRCSIEEVEK